MYGLDPYTRFDELIGLRLIQIAFSMFQLILHLKDDASISIHGVCRVLTEDGTVVAEWKAEELCDLRDFAAFLDHHIIEYLVPGDGSLRLHFDNERWLEILDRYQQFESYVINIGRRVIVV
jgi:hypothetical protein